MAEDHDWTWVHGPVSPDASSRTLPAWVHRLWRAPEEEEGGKADATAVPCGAAAWAQREYCAQTHKESDGK